MLDPLDLNLDRPKVIYQQIRDHVRDLILNGTLTAGTKLPPTAELAQKWNAHPASVHAALTPLVKEGLLTRQPKKGTFVTQRFNHRLSAVGVYYDSNIWEHEANAFKRAVHVELSRLLEAKKVELKIWFDPRPEKQRSTPWPELAQAAGRREFQALIATDVPNEVVAWLQQLPVTSAYFTYASVPNRVALDFDQFAESSVALLKSQGCRSAGVISILEPTKSASAASEGKRADFYEHFASACSLQGIEVRKEWTRMAHGFVPDESQEDFGYHEFGKIWENSPRPEGLVVFPDTSVPGVITALLERRVNVPADLRLVVHRHHEIRFLCPLPVSYLYSSTRQVATALYSQIQRQFSGDICVPIVLPFETQASMARLQ